MKNLISDCIFILDYVHISIRLRRPQDFLKQLGQYVRIHWMVPEAKSNKPIMAGKFKYRSYLHMNRLSKMYLIYEKIASIQGIDALLVMHDVPLLELLQIQKVLEALPSVIDFHFSCIEYRWDFYSTPYHTAQEIQKFIVHRLYLSNARFAMHKGKGDRITYLINKRTSDIQGKMYIQPKKPDPNQREYARLELTVRTRWLRRLNLNKPSDFENFNFQNLFKQMQWLDIKWSKIRSVQINLLTGGSWMKQLQKELKGRGISHVIIKDRKNKVCPTECHKRGHPTTCNLNKAFKRRETHNSFVDAIQRCPMAVEQKRLAKGCFYASKYRKDIIKILEEAYDKWRIIPLFLQMPSVTMHSFKKRERKRKTKRKKSKIHLHELFKKQPLKERRLHNEKES